MSKEVGSHDPADGEVERRGSIAQTEKNRWERLWPVIACGAGLFSDGYLNNVRRPECASLFRSPGIERWNLSHQPSKAQQAFFFEKASMNHLL